MIIFGGFYLNNGFTGAYFDGCFVTVNDNSMNGKDDSLGNNSATMGYYPYTNDNGVDQVVPVILWQHNTDGRSDIDGGIEYMKKAYQFSERKLSFQGWQCDQWKEKWDSNYNPSSPNDSSQSSYGVGIVAIILLGIVAVIWKIKSFISKRLSKYKSTTKPVVSRTPVPNVVKNPTPQFIEEKRNNYLEEHNSTNMFKLKKNIDTFVETHQLDEIINCGQEIIDLDPVNAYAWSRMGYAYAELNKPEKSIECYFEALRIEPDNFIWWNSLGLSYDDAEQYNSALDAYKKSIQANPENYHNLNEQTREQIRKMLEHTDGMGFEKKPYDLKKEKVNIEEAEKELDILQEKLKYEEISQLYDETAEIAISCCQRISMSENTGTMSPQQIIEDKILIDSIIRQFENDIEKHSDRNRHLLVRHIQKNVDSIIEAKQTFGITSFSKGSIENISSNSSNTSKINIAPLEILKKRFAKGEINESEFKKIKKILDE